MATIALKRSGYEAACKAQGWATDAQAAAAAGVAGSTLRRVLHGQTAPGEQLIAGLLTATGWPFDALFVVLQHRHTP